MNTIRQLRKAAGLTMREAAEKMKLPYTTYSGYETGAREPNSEMLIKIADFFNVSIDYIIGRSDENIVNIIPIPEAKEIPLLGTIACGEPILASENINDIIKCPRMCCADFALKCKGDSMINARIFDGDIVYIAKQPDVEDGEIAAVLIGEEATLKRVRKFPNKIVLSPCNPMYDDLVYQGEQLEGIRILGKAVAFLSAVK